jgi:hypothetical protein
LDGATQADLRSISDLQDLLIKFVKIRFKLKA